MKHAYCFLIISSLLSLCTPTLSQRPIVAVFCSGDNKVAEKFKTIAHKLGSQLAVNKFGLVTGGSQTGLMQEVIDGYCSKTNELNNLHGVIPDIFFDYNVHHPAIPTKNLKWVDSLESRLQAFHDLSNSIIVLPGGFGILHELMNFLVHSQLFSSQTKIILFNANHYWDNLIAQFKTMEQHSLLTTKHIRLITEVNSITECIETILATDTQKSLDLKSRFWETD